MTVSPKTKKSARLDRVSSGGVTKRYQPPRGVRKISEFDITKETSLEVNRFESLYQQLNISTARNGGRKVKTVLSERMRLLMVLHWLREKPKLRILAQKFGLSVASVYADIKVRIT